MENYSNGECPGIRASAHCNTRFRVVLAKLSPAFLETEYQKLGIGPAMLNQSSSAINSATVCRRRITRAVAPSTSTSAASGRVL